MFCNKLNPWFSFMEPMFDIVNDCDLVARAKATIEGGAKIPVSYSGADGKSWFVELPGCKKESISAVVENNVLHIEASRKIAGVETKYRLDATPCNGLHFDSDSVKTSYADGILEFRFNEKNKEATKLNIE